MSCTQGDIAKRVGMDVSTVNKILNKRAGPVFRKSTIRKVFRTAKRMGYHFKNPSRAGLCRQALLEILRRGYLKNVGPAKLRWYQRLASEGVR